MRRDRGDDATDATTATDAGASTEAGASTDATAATETFTLLSDETRVGIVRALDESDRTPRRFSELRAAVGVRDGGRFNYHLEKLRGRLVEKRDDGYVLTDEGERVASLV